jgi:hypothetical protein
MIRKTLLGLAAASTLAIAALAPSTASAGGPSFSINFGGGYGGGYGYGPYYGAGYYGDYYGGCDYKEVKVWSNKWQKFVWKTKKICY